MILRIDVHSWAWIHIYHKMTYPYIIYQRFHQNWLYGEYNKGFLLWHVLRGLGRSVGRTEVRLQRERERKGREKPWQRLGRSQKPQQTTWPEEQTPITPTHLEHTTDTVVKPMHTARGKAHTPTANENHVRMGLCTHYIWGRRLLPRGQAAQRKKNTTLNSERGRKMQTRNRQRGRDKKCTI